MQQPASPRPSPPWYTLFFSRGHLLALSIIILLVAGFSAITTLPRLEDPRIDTRNVIILTPYPGASAERVEALVTDVIEDELRQLFEIKELRSTSRAGISVINVLLQGWVDNTTNEQIFSKIRDRLGAAQQKFPAGAGTPELDEKRGATSFTMLIAMGSAPGVDTPLPILNRMSEELADRLRNAPGTELVRIFGGLDEEITVRIDPQQLASAGLSIADASRLVAGADPKLPAGVIRTPQQNVRVQVANELDSLAVIRNIPLSVSGEANFLRLGDIAEVNRGWQNPPTNIALADGERVVFIAARMQPTVRIDHWAAGAKDVLDSFNKLHGGSIQADIVFDQNIYTQARLSDLTQNLVLGCLVVMAVVLLFMGTRSAWIVGLSLPLSAAFTVFSLTFYGEQIHQMSIFGIIIAIGLLIDNAIVITDEVRSNLLDRYKSRMDALVLSLKHLFSPLLASTLTTILGFMPIFLLSDNIGDFVGPIAISVVMALIGSLFISLTIIAALAARYLPRPDTETRLAWYRSGINFPLVTDWYQALLSNGLRKPWLLLGFTIGLPVMGFVLSGQLGNVFFPSADRNQFEVLVWLPNGTAIQQTHQQATAMDAAIREHPGIQKVSWMVGGSTPSIYYNQIMTRDNTPHFAQAVVTTDSVSRAAALINRLQTQLDTAFPQAQVVVRPFGQGPPIEAPIGADIIGPDLAELSRLGEQVRLAMSSIPGVIQSTSSITLNEPELVVNTTRDTASLAQLSLADVAGQLQASLDGQLGGSILEGTEEIPVRIRLPDQQRSTVGGLAAAPLVNAPLASQQQWLPLSAIGDLTLRPSIAGISRFDGERTNVVDGFLTPGATAVDVSNQLQQKLAGPDFELPEGYRIKLKGDADKQQEALGQLATYIPVLVVLMLTTLILTFSSVKLAAVIGSVAVLSVGLGMFSLWLSGMPIGFNPILGSAGLIGVAINGSIVVIAAINANPAARLGDTDAIVHETMSCSRHILSTTFTTVGGFIPLLLFSEGSFWPPLAVVLAGGVGFSVILSLLFTPLVVGLLAKRRGRQINAAEQITEAGLAAQA